MSLYGCVLWDLSSSNVNQFYVSWRKCIRQLIGINQRSHGNYFHLIVNDIGIEDQLLKRFVKFFNGVIESENQIVKFCASMAVNGTNSSVCRNLNYIGQ